MDTQYKKYWVWVSLIKLGVRKKLDLLKNYNYDVEKLFNSTKEEMIKKHIDEKTIKNILENKDEDILKSHLKYMKDNQIDIIAINDEQYPKLLKEIYDPPVCLYIIGNKYIMNNTNISIIGCRNSSEYGNNVAKKIAYDISKEKINIVSGLARGIDTYAHIGCLMAKGHTIAVLGNGLDMIYPSENSKIASEIKKNEGAIISEYPLGTKPSKYTFPQRNRIVSGMSKGIVVVEAKNKSGTLITVDYALEQGRDVFAIPGNIDQENSIGTNELIKNGSKLVTNYKDIINEY